MPSKISLILFLLISFNKIYALEQIGSINEERANLLYSICDTLLKITDSEYITIKKGNDLQKEYSLAELKNKLSLYISKDTLNENKTLKIFPNEKEVKNSKTKIIKNPRIFFYSEKNGKSILKFECKYIRFFRKKIGPFEIPYKNHIIKEPSVQIL